jgi:hypothetical protein
MLSAIIKTLQQADRLVVAAEPIELSLTGETGARRGPETRFSGLPGCPLNPDTKSRENFNPPVSRRAITHYDKDAVGIGAWSLHLEIEHVVVAWHHVEFGVWKRHAENSVVEVCTTDNGNKVFVDT